MIPENKDDEILEAEEIDESRPSQNPLEDREAEIECRLQELEILIDNVEMKLMESENDDNLDAEEYEEKYYQLKEEYNSLLKERKLIHKQKHQNDKSYFNQVSIWILLYGFIIILVCAPFVAGQLWVSVFTNIGNSLSIDVPEGIRLYIILIGLISIVPVALFLLSWFLYVNVVKKKQDKITFLVIWGIQTALSIGLVIYLSTVIIGALS